MTKHNDHRFILFIRSLLFSIFSITSIILYSFVCLLSLPFSLSFRHAVIRVFLHGYLFVFRRLCQVEYRIQGLENIPTDRVGVIMAKHQSTWETFYLPLIFHDPAVILKRELLWIPFFGWGLAMADPIAINRNDKRSAMQQIIEKGKRCLNAGRWVLFFPEGTRTAPGVVSKYHLGGARFAVATQSPVIPVAHNAGRIWPRRQFLKRPGTITLVVGPLIEVKGKTADEVLTSTKDWIESTMVDIDGFEN